MIATILGLFSTAKTALSGGWIKWALIGGAVLTLATTLFVYVGNHSAMKVEIVNLKNQAVEKDFHIEALERELANRNVRLAKERERRVAEALAAELRLEAAKAAAEDLRAEAERVREELAVTRFETLEAIRDDEDMADWVDGTVPPAAWGLLRAAAEGRSGN